MLSANKRDSYGDKCCKNVHNTGDRLFRKVCKFLFEDHLMNISVYISKKTLPWLLFHFCTKTKEKINTFHDIFNGLHESIKCIIESDEKQISFLDNLNYGRRGSIVTDLYCKDTDTHEYLNFKTNHPSHSIKEIFLSIWTDTYAL